MEPGRTITVEKLEAGEGERVELRDVLLVSAQDGTSVGTPLVEGAHVVAEVVEQGRGKKVVVFKYQAKTRYRRKRGHRQPFTKLAIRQIVTPSGTYGQAPEEAEPPAATEEQPKRTRRRKAAAPEATES